ncbi:hypothetical protein GCM10010193_25180 [Kitasatospora atroaurantiaca]|uniref:CopC domain-containing protein n=1 Tax=Kitasatospora atroaurantiaca TaxID=285545 RepID=A0A561F0M3_9ACTN|nr:hypothetical protein [Kitasatospora atroaurantiaca]TWE21411.1 hypothetical protein FB465_6594 [Kitasatospora atroaurantiaca]
MPHRSSVVACTALAGLFALGPAATAYAHGDTIRLTVTGVAAGHPQFTAAWENDNDPVDERIAGTLSATAVDGTAVGPWRLVPVPGHPGALTTNEVLPPGHWTITAETAFPGLGRGEGVVDVPVVDPRPATTPSVATSTAATPPVATPPVGPTVPGGSPTSGPSGQPTDQSPNGSPKAASDHPSGWTRTFAALGVAAVSVAAIAAGVWFLRRSARP